MLPPPMTRATVALIRTTATISSARRLIVSKSKPMPLSPARASPESLTRTRGYLTPAGDSDTQLLGAELEPDEAAHLNVLAGLRRHLLHEIGDGLAGVAHPRLVHERDVLVERLELTRHDLLDHVLRLAALTNLLLEDTPLLLDAVRRHAIAIHRDRRSRRDVLGERTRQVLEIVGAGDEVGLAIQLDEDGQLAVVVQVMADVALFHGTVGSLLGLGDALLAKILDRLVDVSVRLLERLLAIHHAGAGPRTELGHVLRRKIRRRRHLVLPVTVRGNAAGRAGGAFRSG